MAALALEGLIEALDVSDIVGEMGAAYEEWQTPTTASNFIGPLEQTPSGVREYTLGTLGIGGAAGSGAIPEVAKRLRFDSVSSHGSTKTATTSRGVGGSSFTSFKNMPKVSRIKQKRRARRSAPYARRRRRINTGAAAGAAMSRIATGSRHIGKNVIIKKMAYAPTPTTSEPGAALTHILTNVNSATTPDGGYSFSYAFKLSQFPNYANYIAMYQWYKILWVKLHFYPMNNSYPGLNRGTSTFPVEEQESDGTGKISSGAPLLIVAPDHSSDAIFTNSTEAMEHDGAKLHMFNDGNDFSVFLSPKPTGLVGSAGSEVVYLTPANKWITTTSAEVPHYGLRCRMEQNDHSAIKVIMEMKVAFRGNKTS